MDNYHLKKDGDQWKLTKEGAQRASKTFGDSNKQEATRQAADYMKSHSGSMKIHKMNGRIQEERTYPRSVDPKKSPG